MPISRQSGTALDALQLDEVRRKPWIDMLIDVRYLLDESLHLSAEENTIMTELRQRWEREKAELRAEGMAVGKAEGILAVLTRAVTAAADAEVIAA